jgi:hypothetical protein
LASIGFAANANRWQLKPDRGRTGTGWVHPLYPIDLHRAASLESRLRRAIALNQQSAQPAFRQDDLP